MLSTDMVVFFEECIISRIRLLMASSTRTYIKLIFLIHFPLAKITLVILIRNFISRSHKSLQALNTILSYILANLITVRNIYSSKHL